MIKLSQPIGGCSSDDILRISNDTIYISVAENISRYICHANNWKIKLHYGQPLDIGQNFYARPETYHSDAWWNSAAAPSILKSGWKPMTYFDILYASGDDEVLYLTMSCGNSYDTMVATATYYQPFSANKFHVTNIFQHGHLRRRPSFDDTMSPMSCWRYHAKQLIIIKKERCRMIGATRPAGLLPPRVIIQWSHASRLFRRSLLAKCNGWYDVDL